MYKQLRIFDYLDETGNINILLPYIRNKKKKVAVYTLQCGTQCLGCDYPIHFDTYTGCSHLCEYCFANEKPDKNIVMPCNGAINALKLFIQGKRTSETRFCDWNIPIHWGATSDPFQPIERAEKKSLECLELLAETKYPFIVSTKGTLIAEEPYLSLIGQCNCVVQISAACAEYDALESGAPTFAERMRAIEKLSKKARLNIRIQPYLPIFHRQIINSIKTFSDCGAYGIIVEGLSVRRKSKRIGDMEWNGSRFQYPIEVLAEHFKEIRSEVHNCGLKFFCGETRLQYLGDDLTCCGTMGLDGFTPNKYNIAHMAYDDTAPIPTEQMKQPRTARPFRSFRQTTEWSRYIKDKSFAEMMEDNEDFVEWLKELKGVYE
ncbi:MAG: radical SAM protein [Clostridium sp.]|nr:radical SAM protein [Lachnospiraceae bacterium]MCM1254336.1 radical SAM protein [Clostridium sp.]